MVLYVIVFANTYLCYTILTQLRDNGTLQPSQGLLTSTNNKYNYFSVIDNYTKELSTVKTGLKKEKRQC